MKAKIRNTFKRDDFSDKIYAKTQEDKAHRFCEGPFTEEDVDRHLGTKDWVPLRRFGVDQKGVSGSWTMRTRTGPTTPPPGTRS